MSSAVKGTPIEELSKNVLTHDLKTLIMQQRRMPRAGLLMS